MRSIVLSPPLLGFIVGTRAVLAFGIGLLVAGRIPEPRRRTIAMALIGLGAATTVPAATLVFRNRGGAWNRRANAGRGVRTVADM